MLCPGSGSIHHACGFHALRLRLELILLRKARETSLHRVSFSWLCYVILPYKICCLGACWLGAQQSSSAGRVSPDLNPLQSPNLFKLSWKKTLKIPVCSCLQGLTRTFSQKRKSLQSNNHVGSWDENGLAPRHFLKI